MKKIEIISNHVVLHFDEYPILFIGKNYKSDIVIGSLICEDDENNTVKYFHSIISNSIAVKFLEREISYLEVLKAASYISIVTKDYNDVVLAVEEKDFYQLDKSILPLPTAYCTFIGNKTMINKFRGSYVATYSMPETMNYPLVAAKTFSEYGVTVDKKS